MSIPGDSGSVPSSPARAKPKASVARNAVGIVLLIGLSAVAFIEWNARRQAVAACDHLERALEEHKNGPRISRAEAEAIIGRPTHESDADQLPLYRVNYVWNGVFRRHIVTAEYRKQPDTYLVNVILD